MKKIKVTENGIRKMILEEITDMNAITVYRCGDIVNEKDFVDVVWFSSKPIKINKIKNLKIILQVLFFYCKYYVKIFKFYHNIII